MSASRAEPDNDPKAAGLPTHAYPAAPNRCIFSNISFDIDNGACVALVGASGSGKSTLAQVIAGHLNPKAGRVLFAERDMTGKPGRHALLVHQDSDLFPWQSAEQHLWMALGRKDPVTSDSLLDLVGLRQCAGYFPAQLSGGVQKRLALARGLALSPNLLILDETFSSLDKATKDRLIDDLETVWQETGSTLLLITHDPTEIDRLATATIQMRKKTA